mmetsp:Transcript_56010/g.157883  ORF Transcript_56010/g.157883 Transcript_56010/m.157883 type:complete len:238 (+) Transcript_56010:2432-3145(+)
MPGGGSRKSFSRPGVAMRIWGRVLISASCAPFGAPPYRHVARIPTEAPNVFASHSIWQASSRVGAITSTAGGPRKLSLLSMSLAKAGSRKASVFPEPVFATPIRSRPDVSTGHAYCWIAVGAGKPVATKADTTLGGKETSCQERHGPPALPALRTSTSLGAAGAAPLGLSSDAFRPNRRSEVSSAAAPLESPSLLDIIWPSLAPKSKLAPKLSVGPVLELWAGAAPPQAGNVELQAL